VGRPVYTIWRGCAYKLGVIGLENKSMVGPHTGKIENTESIAYTPGCSSWFEFGVDLA